MKEDRDLVSSMDTVQRMLASEHLRCISPTDAKYWSKSKKLADCLSAEAEWRACAEVQRVLLETRAEFGEVNPEYLEEMNSAMDNFDPLNASLLEGELKHDQRAVIAEIGRHMSDEAEALLHPGTTSYDILDTARSYLLKRSWNEIIRPQVAEVIGKLADLAERYLEEGTLQAGRTHLQLTSPVPFGATLALYAGRLAERTEKCDLFFKDLRGKISGIVGSGGSIEQVIGKGKALEFEEKALEKLGLKPDYTATQIVQKERLADVGHSITTLVSVLGDFANDMRLLYSSGIEEVTSGDNAERLGGSSADATKNNPINYENIDGNVAVVQSGMPVLYSLIKSDLQRDLRGSVVARHQPQLMLAQTYESFCRAGKTIDKLTVITDSMEKNLQRVSENPSEAMVALLRGEKWVHSEYGPGYNFVKEMGKKHKKTGRPLLDLCLEDSEFKTVFDSMDQEKQEILRGDFSAYVRPAYQKAEKNIQYARKIIGEK